MEFLGIEGINDHYTSEKELENCLLYLIDKR
jgi:hypothetical protein